MTKPEATELALKYIENAIPVSIVGRYLKNDADIKLFHECYLEQLQMRK